MSHSVNPRPRPHLALLPSSGMGHLTPFLRLTTSLTAHDIQITLVTAHPTVSLAESETLTQFSSAYPQVMHEKMLIPPIISNDSTAKTDKDPFILQYEAIRRSSHIISPLLSSLSPPVTAVITDMSLTSVVVPITKTLKLPNYILFTSSAKMLAMYAFYHKIADHIEDLDDIVISGLLPIPKSWLPPPILTRSSNLLKTHFIENGKSFMATNGILVNTFEELEKESLTALNSGLVVDQFPPVIAIGPLVPSPFERGEVLTWLDEQPPQSVLYVSFGTRAAISRDQVRELGAGLVESKFKFLWVVKSKMVDQEDEEELEEIVGRDIFKELKQRGLVVKTWMKQEQILSHKAIGGFLSHCGWNSVTEAVWHGIPILAWPRNADQKINADLIRRNMIGKWDESWGWAGKELVKRDEIAQKVKEIMEDKLLIPQAEQIRNRALSAVGHEGSSQKALTELINLLS